MKHSRFSRLWIFCCLLAGSMISNLSAQIAGRINGRAIDPSGAAVANVRLILTATATGLSRSGVTGADGFYEFADVLPGKYTLTAEAPGFQKQVISNITLEVAQVLRQDLNLVLGAASERVEVTASAVALQTEDSQIGGVVETKAVNDLPLNGRDFTQLMILLPGASEGTPSGTTGKHYVERVAGLSFTVNGQRSNYNQFLIDGFMAKEVQSGTAAVSPIIDSLMEFREQSSNYSAQFGIEAGGQVNTVLKSGTNDLHGALWEYLRNDDFDSNDFFSNLSGRSKGEYRRNQFGGAGGGPVILPKYNGRDRTFIYGAVEGTRVIQGVTPLLTTVPTVTQRQGIFSTPIKDPLTGINFPNNQIPENRISSINSTILQKWVPLPNNGTGTLNWYANFPSSLSGFYSNWRIDQRVSGKDSIFGHYLFNDTRYDWAKTFPTDGTTDNTRGQNVLVHWTHIFGPHMLNDLHAGYSRFFETEFEVREYKENVVRELGISGLCEMPGCWGIPQENVTGYQFFGEHGGVQPRSGPRGWSNQFYQIQDSVSRQSGSHSTSFGIALNQNFDNFVQVITPRGNYSYDGRFTGGAGNLNNALADYLLGIPFTTALANTLSNAHWRYKSFQPFVQDDWRVSSELTINLGFRYEINKWPRPKRNDMVTLLLNPAQGTAQLVTAQNPGNLPHTLKYMDWHNLDPRVGFAYSPKALRGKTVIRAAYGIFTQREGINSFSNEAGNPPFQQTATITINSVATDPLYFGNFNLANPWALAGTALPTITTMPQDFKNGRVQQWNFNIQQRITSSMLLDVAYVGNHDSHLALLTVINNRPPGPGPTTTNKPFPAYAGISFIRSVGDTNYNGLQVKLEKRYSNGVQFISSYTYSKCIDNGPGTNVGEGGTFAQDAVNNLRGARGPCAQDARQRYSLSGIYALPFGKGKQFLSGISRAGDTLLGGWQFNGILTLRSGQPFTVVMSSDIANVGGTTWANAVGDPNHGPQTISKWFNTSAFVAPAQYTFGNEGRDTVVGPPVNNLDFSLFKVFTVTEHKSFQFRGELFNALNHSQFALPAATLGVPTFGQISSTLHPARQIQLSLKFLF
jgi:Carboxypeptidase regulatory-like domain